MAQKMQPGMLQSKLWLFSWAFFMFVAVFYLLAVNLAGGSLLGFICYAGCFLFLLFLPGLFTVNTLLKSQSVEIKLFLAIPFGASILVLAYMFFAGLLGALNFFAYTPSIVLATVQLVNFFLEYKNTNVKNYAAQLKSVQASFLIVLFSLLLFTYTFTGVLPYAKPHVAGNMLYSQDLLWSVGNAAAVRFGFPLVDLRATGGVMHYHYFTEAVTGLIAFASGQSAFDAVCYYTWPVWVALLVCGLYILGKRLGMGKAALLPPVGATLLTFLERSGAVHTFLNPNNVLQNYVYLLCTLILVSVATQSPGALQAAGQKLRQPAAARLVTAFAICMFGFAFGKSTIAVLFLCGCLAAAVVFVLLHKKVPFNVPGMVVAGTAVTALLYMLIFSKAVVNLVFAPSYGAFFNIAKILLIQVGPVFWLYSIAVFYNAINIKELSFTELVINAMVPGGLFAACLFNHYSASQMYFFLTACFLMWLTVGRAVKNLETKKAHVQLLALAVCMAAFCGTMLITAPMLRTGVQVELRGLGLRPPYTETAARVSLDDENAALWLAANMQDGEIFATNRNAQDKTAGEGVFHAYTALSGQQAYVESWRYAMDYSMNYYTLRHNLEVVSDGIFACQTFEEARVLALENGINYLLLYLPYKGQPFTGGTPVFVSDTVLIYKV